MSSGMWTLHKFTFLYTKCDLRNLSIISFLFFAVLIDYHQDMNMDLKSYFWIENQKIKGLFILCGYIYIYMMVASAANITIYPSHWKCRHENYIFMEEKQKLTSCSIIHRMQCVPVAIGCP